MKILCLFNAGHGSIIKHVNAVQCQILYNTFVLFIVLPNNARCFAQQCLKLLRMVFANAFFGNNIQLSLRYKMSSEYKITLLFYSLLADLILVVWPCCVL